MGFNFCSEKKYIVNEHDDCEMRECTDSFISASTIQISGQNDMIPPPPPAADNLIDRLRSSLQEALPPPPINGKYHISAPKIKIKSL